MNSKAIIIIQGIKDPKHYAFDYPLESQLLKMDKNILVIDSFSDRGLIHPILKTLDQNEKTFIVLDTRISTEIGIGQSILNACIKDKTINLTCIGEATRVTPFLKLFDGKVFSSEQELIDYISSN